MQWLHTAVTSSEDIIVDLHAHNGAKERYRRFWEIVGEIIEERTAVDDHRHGALDDGTGS